MDLRPIKGLTVKQDLFVRHYLATLEATRAARLAGYSPGIANRRGSLLLKTLRIRVAIEAELHRRRQAAKDEEAYVVEGLKEVAERCMQRVPCKNAAGRPTGVWRFDAQGAVRALELLGKRAGVFTELNPGGGDLKDVPDEELEDRIEQILANRQRARAPSATH